MLKSKFFIPAQARTTSSDAVTEGDAGFPVNTSNYMFADLFVNVTALSGTSPTLTVSVQIRDPLSGVWATVKSTSAISATGTTLLTIAESYTNESLGDQFRVSWVISGTSPSVTFSIGGILSGPT